MSDIQIAHNIIQPKKDKKLKTNPIDDNYESLKCKLTTLKEKSAEHEMISQYLDNTKDGRRLKLLDVFKVTRDGEDKRFNPKALGNKFLLWHGSRFSNFAGILS